MTDQHSLLQYFETVGIHLHPHLYLTQDPLTGLSFYTSATLPQDSIVIWVPTRLCITFESAFERIRLLLQHLSGYSVEVDAASLPAPDWILLYLVLTRLYEGYVASNRDEQLRTIVFEHLPYVSHIPKVIGTPLLFSTAELALLVKTPLVGSTERRLKETIVDYERARGLISPHLTGQVHPFAAYLSSNLQPLSSLQLDLDPLMSQINHPALELWRWAESAFTSRSFPPRLINSSSSTTPILIPGYDTFNHARARPVTWSADPDLVQMTLRYEVEAGGQVYNNYGGKSNEEFLSGYGFTLDSGWEDTLALKLPGVERTHYWRLTAAADGVEGVVEGEAFVKGTCPCPTLLADLQAHILQSQPPPTDPHDQLELYASVLETLESLLLTKRKAFRQSQSDFDASTPSQATVQEWNRANTNLIRQQVYENVKQYRKGQLELLNHAVKWTRGELERVVDVLDAQDDGQESQT